MEFAGWARSDTGDVRAVNQDNCLSRPESGVFAVADGVGGKEDGELASQMVVDAIGAWADQVSRMLRESDPATDRQHRMRIVDALVAKIEEINTAIFERGSGNMGTTCDVMLVAEGVGFIGHVGDSRVYLVRDGQIVQLTDDHTFAERLRRQGDDEGDSPSFERYTHVLTRSIGGDPHVDVDTIFVDVCPGDRFILCSDGVSDVLDPDTIKRADERLEPEMLSNYLVDAAYRHGTTDNATALVVDVTGQRPTGFGEKTPVDTIRKVTFLEQVELFEGLASQDLLKLLRIVYKETRADGEVIIEKGDEADAMFMLLEGGASLRVDGSEVVRLGPGEHFGEMALFGTDVRTADAVACGQTVLLVLPADDFRRLVKHDDPAFGNKLLTRLLEQVSNRLRTTTEELMSLRKTD